MIAIIKDQKSTFRTVFLTVLLWLSIGSGQCEQPLVFVSVPDLHNIESFMQDPEPTKIPNFDFLLAGMASFKPRFILTSGDLGIQHWWETEYQGICAPGGTLGDIILGCAAKTYPRLLNYMSAHGLPSVYVAVGDHEIGDNAWPQGIHSDAVPYFKQAFSKYFTKKADGSSRFNGTLGGVPLRPINTPYAHTSYAFKIANVLFIAVDEFRQDSPTLRLGRYGTVKTSVEDDGHLQWLDKLLTAARQQSDIKHIIVSGHLPVLSPVRGRGSSMLYLDWQQDSAFWKLLRKYQVDLYLAGEVHQTTVIKDPSSHIIQIAHKGGCCKQDMGGFLIGRAYADRIEFEQQSLQINSSGIKSFVKEGTLVIDKSQGKFLYRATGNLLQPINPKGLVVHYSFDGDVSNAVKNYGSFGAGYDATPYNIGALVGVLGEAAWFNDAQQSILTSLGITPISGQQPRTVSAWIRTANKNSGAYIYPSGNRNFFRLLVANGILKLQIDSETLLQANQGTIRLNDNYWHHVAVTFRRNWSAEKDEVLFYIDGQKYDPVNTVSKTIFTHVVGDKVNVGGRRTDQSTEGWTGSLDDFAIWASALTAPMIKAINTCAGTLIYNASDMESLFNIYRKKSGNINIKGMNWKYTTRLIGEPGVCKQKSATRYSLNLNEKGEGVVTYLK